MDQYNFKVFLTNLLTQLASGDFNVFVECKNDKLFEARVIGYSEEYMRVKVRFFSDDLTKPGTKRVPTVSFGYVSEDEYDLVHIQVPVKEEDVYFSSIILKHYQKPELEIGDRVVKNNDTWIPNDFDSWGRGEGVGIVVEPPHPIDDDNDVDVKWPRGRCFEKINQLIKI